MTTDTTPDSHGATTPTPVLSMKAALLARAAAAGRSTPDEEAPARFAGLDLKGLDRLDIGAAARNARPVLDFVLPGMLSGTVAILVGPGGVSKSMLALQTAAVIGTGLDHWSLWSDREPVPVGRVAVFNIEDPAIVLQARIHDIAASTAIAASEREMFINTVHDNVDVWPLSGRGFAFGRKQADGRILPTDWISWIEERLEGVRLAIVDTFVRGLDGLDENSSTEVAPVLAILEAVCRRRGVTFLILHHVNKASSAPGASGAQQAARGSSALTDNARWQTNLATMTEAEAQSRGVEPDERRRWVQVDLSKCNYGAPIEGRWLHRGEGGVLYGAQQPAVPVQAAPTKGKQPVGGGGHGPVVTRVPKPDALDKKVGW